MKIAGAWYIDAYPDEIIIEKEDGSLGMFHLVPFREISDDDIRPYKGQHPREIKGQLLPIYLYKFYGLERETEILSELLRIRVSPLQLKKIQVYAKNNKTDMSKVLRDYIDSL